MNKSTVVLTTLFLGVLALGASAPAQQTAKKRQPAPQAAVKVQTLRAADTADLDTAPEDKPYSGKAPGSQKRIARTFAGQPPLVPHSIEDIDAINLEGNSCLNCHGPDNYKYANAPKASDSHFKDSDGKQLTDVSPLRNQCTSCHVPQVDAKPLVQNTFKGTVTAKKK